MQLDVRNYLKKLRDTENLEELEKELNDLIKESRSHKDPVYDKSPILGWFATKKITKPNHRS